MDRYTHTYIQQTRQKINEKINKINKKTKNKTVEQTSQKIPYRPLGHAFPVMVPSCP
jgi:galactose-1-phosphate uridylyltransferase